MSERQPLRDALDTTLSSPPEGTSAPAGIAAAVRRAGLDVRAAVGERSVAGSPRGELPMTPATAHDLASVTKVLTTTAVMRLVSQRLFSLDDPAERFLPRFTGEKAAITIRDLLLHRAGLWEWWPLYVDGDADRTLDELPLRYPIGQQRHYSDLGFLVLGRVVSAVVGTPLDDAVAELVTRPLALTATRYACPADPSDVAMSAYDDRVEIAMLDNSTPYPIPYRSSDFTGWRTGPIVGVVNDGNAFHAYAGIAGHAGLFSTLDDLLALGTALARSVDGDDLVDAAVAHSFFGPGPDVGQSLGFRRYTIRIDGRAVDMIGHTGYVGCALGFVPGCDVVVAMTSNRLVTPATPTTTDELWRSVIDAAAAELETMT